MKYKAMFPKLILSTDFHRRCSVGASRRMSPVEAASNRGHLCDCTMCSGCEASNRRTQTPQRLQLRPLGTAALWLEALIHRSSHQRTKDANNHESSEEVLHFWPRWLPNILINEIWTTICNIFKMIDKIERLLDGDKVTHHCIHVHSGRVFNLWIWTIPFLCDWTIL